MQRRQSEAGHETLRDAHGFEVNREFSDLYHTYAPIWDQEEDERTREWTGFLLQHVHLYAPGQGRYTNLISLAEEGLQDIITVAESSKESNIHYELQQLVLMGVPVEVRGLAWKVFLDVSVRKQKGYYEHLVEKSLGELKASRGVIDNDEIRDQVAVFSAQSEQESEFNLSASSWISQGHVWLLQIEKDLPRTFPRHPLMQSTGRSALRRVLAAYALHNPDVGYCQGMNFVAGALLMFMDEEDAFWCLKAVVEEILTGYYAMDMLATQVCMHKCMGRSLWCIAATFCLPDLEDTCSCDTLLPLMLPHHSCI